MNIYHDNYRLVITPDIRFLNEAGIISVCRTIKEDIERHVDGVQYIEIESDELCGHCLMAPEPDRTGEPTCCDKAYDDWKKETCEHSFAIDVKLPGVQRSCVKCGEVYEEPLNEAPHPGVIYD